ncbi:MAG: Jag N-terminal domain-containing protein [Candidatus Cloacimonetes bacterium]|nr:Jag N-terminal domain-containing protein [Candidatus Cloacimonadota bacterium]
MKEIQREGISADKVISDFMKEFNISKEDISYTIIDKGSKGVLSLVGIKPAIVKFFIPEEEDILKRFIDGLLKRMNVEYQEIDLSYKDNYYYLHVKGVDNPGFLIGKEGKMLISIQHFLNKLLENGEDERNRVILNIDNYRAQHEERLQKKIDQIVKKVKKREKSITLEPMNASDRRIIYRYLENDDEVRTMTIGKGDVKRIVIYPAGNEDQRRPEKHRKLNDSK